MKLKRELEAGGFSGWNARSGSASSIGHQQSPLRTLKGIMAAKKKKSP